MNREMYSKDKTSTRFDNQCALIGMKRIKLSTDVAAVTQPHIDIMHLSLIHI